MKCFSIVLGIVLFALSPALAQTAQPCAPGSTATAIAFPAGDSVDVPPVNGESRCFAATREIRCGKDGSYIYTFTVTNNTGATVTSVLLTPPAGSGFSISPQSPPLPGGSLAHGQSAMLQVTITGGQPGQKICFPITLLSRERGCCTVQVCVELPNCCAVIERIRLTCNPDGTYSFVFTVTNRTGVNVQHIYLHAPAGTTITPSYFAVNLGPGATSPPLAVTISGAKPGRFCFGVSLHTEGMKSCCTFDYCIELPECGGSQTSCREGVCCSRAPRYEGTQFTGQKIAAVTGNNQLVPQGQNHVLTVFDMSGANGWGTNGTTPPPNHKPPFYTGPAGSEWTAKNLGSVFGVAIDHLGNIYVTSTAAYSLDTIGAAGPGGVYRIRTGTGAIDNFASLPNTPDSSNRYPALGNIAFDCQRKQLFVTNMDDGRIYRLDMNGVVRSTFDHTTQIVTNNGNPEAGDAPGVSPMGELLWGIEVHHNRVFYSVNGEDCGHQNANPAIKNEIWSVGLTITGDFDPNDRRREVQIPDLPGSDFSNPITDISFGRDGRMAVAERSMSSFTDVTAHSSRVLEFLCTRDRWVLAPPIAGAPYKYNVGAALGGCADPASRPSNAAGGIRYDHDPNATYGLWATGDALQFFTAPVIYGFMGFPLAGGSSATGPLEALYTAGTQFKTQIGDIELSCPPNDNAY